ncbi:MAG: hypothetical protein Q7U14_01300 [Lacisediminimonas sp.]|nr:hypothetical protein [Lacisediminimonas sp.]
MQALNLDLRRAFLLKYLACGGDKEAAIKLRGWARITRAHRAEVIGVLNEPDQMLVSIHATYRALSRSVDFTALPWNSRLTVEHQLKQLATDYSSLHLDIGEASRWWHAGVSHFDALGKFFSQTNLRNLVLNFSDIQAGDSVVNACLAQLRQTAAHGTSAAPVMALHWHRADIEGPIFGLLDQLADDQHLADRFRLVSLDGLRLVVLDNAPLVFSDGMLRYLARSTKLRSLSLRKMPISGQLPPLLAALEQNDSVNKLNLGRCNLVTADARLLEAFLSRRTSMRLVLDGNLIDRNDPIWENPRVSGRPPED